MKLVSSDYWELIAPEGFCNNLLGKQSKKKILFASLKSVTIIKIKIFLV